MNAKNLRKIPKRKRNIMTLGQKIEILDRIHKGEKTAEVARSLNMNESSIRTIKKMRTKYETVLLEVQHLALKLHI
jgi:DNA-binding NarL/FixJ family response regulator